MTDIETLGSALQCIPLFSGLPAEQLNTLAASAFYQTYPRGQIIFSRGDQGDRAFVVVKGAIDLVIDSVDGRELILSRLGVGEHFGEMALVDDNQRSAAARAAGPTELVVVLRSAFLRCLDQQPELGRQIIRSLVKRLRTADEKIEAFAYLDAGGRIARTILELDKKHHESIPVSHEELSHMSATSRQTTTRILGEWEDAGYVDLSRRGIVVKDDQALALLAEL
jgi:CRP/FNR family cyclic AMP-dependent transcriptional regulator